MTSPTYSITNLDVYESNTGTLSDGTAVCTGLDVTGNVTCGTDLKLGATYQFQFTVTNSGSGDGVPGAFEFNDANGAGDVLGPIAATDSTCGCNDDGADNPWVNSIVGGTTLSCTPGAGTTCTVELGGGTEVWYFIITIKGGAADETATATVKEGGDNDVTGTLTFTVAGRQVTILDEE